MNIVLFVSAGNTDLQVLINELSGETFKELRAETVNENLRAFHQHLISNPACYEIDDSFPPKPKSRDYKLKWRNEELAVVAGKEEAETGLADVHSENGIIKLVPAKLAGVAAWLKNPGQYEESPGRHEKYCHCETVKVIVFYTHRDRGDREPVAVGPVLATWLKKYFSSLDKKIEAIPVNILSKGRLEGENARHPVNPGTVKIINDCVKNAAANKEWTACVSAAGGMNDVKALVKACVRFHFTADRYFELEIKEGREQTHYFNDKELPAAIDSFRAREHAVALIKQGDFAGAYGAVTHLKDDEFEKKWLQKVKDAADYFAGILSYRNDLPGYLSTLIHWDKPRCLLVAMRVEAALRAQRIPEAVFWTSTFFHDAAMLDLIQKIYNLKRKNFDEEKRIITFPGDTVPDSDLYSSSERENWLLRHKYDTKYKYNIAAYNLDAWFNGLKKDAPQINMESFMAYNNRLKEKIEIIRDKSSKQGVTITTGSQQNRTSRRDTLIISATPNELRNLNAHSIVTGEKIKYVEAMFNKVGLWGKDGFLTQAIVQNIFTELGMSKCPKFYTDLVAGLCQDLRDGR
ncbi:MAG: hypothetical protein GY862_15075 [Gammaproteobacteria bacterium]|nr:hypothetical protein [Gammaproteobacteria bacterium]